MHWLDMNISVLRKFAQLIIYRNIHLSLHSTWLHECVKLLTYDRGLPEVAGSWFPGVWCLVVWCCCQIISTLSRVVCEQVSWTVFLVPQGWDWLLKFVRSCWHTEFTVVWNLIVWSYSMELINGCLGWLLS